MRCNIDAKGKAVRLTIGMVSVIAGLLVLVLYLSKIAQTRWFMIIAIVLLANGVFAIFQGWSGWCVVRAMGFRTRV